MSTSHRTSRPLRLRRVDASATRMRALLGAGRVWRTPTSSGPWARFELGLPCGSREIDLPACATAPVAGKLLLHTDAGRLELADASLLRLGSGILLDREWPQAVFHDLARLACACVQHELSQALGGAWRVADSAPAGSAPAGSAPAHSSPADAEPAGPALLTLSLTLIAAASREQHVLSVRASVDTVEALLSNAGWHWRASRTSSAWTHRLPGHAHVLVGHVDLSIRRLQALARGDLVVVQGRGEERALYLRAGSANFTLTAAPEDTVASGAPTLKVSNMSMTLDDPGAAHAASMPVDSGPAAAEAPSASGHLLADMEVRVEFVAARTRMAIGAVCALEPGAIVTLAGPAGTRVDIVVNGLRVGRGELVDVEGCLAVEVLDMNACRPDDSRDADA